MQKLIKAVEILEYMDKADKKNSTYLHVLSGCMLASSFTLLVLGSSLWFIVIAVIAQYLVYNQNKPEFTFYVENLDGEVIHVEHTSYELAKGTYDNLYLNFDRDKFNIETWVRL